MSEKDQGMTRTSQSSQTPPPCDPLQRYQTPWPRTEDEGNPFIRFRRFADEQFKAFFAGFPSMMSSNTMQRDLDQHVDHFVRVRDEIQKEWKEQLEQEIVQHRRAAQNHRDEIYEILRQRQGQWEPISTSAEPDTELEAYGRLIHSDESEKRHCLNSDSVRPFSRRWTEQLDPFQNPQHIIPWLLFDKEYSPSHLSDPIQPNFPGFFKWGRHERHMGWAHFAETQLDVLQAEREKLAQLPLMDAFEDLMSITQTGTMVERHGQSASNATPPQDWFYDMVQRGSLGPAWSVGRADHLLRAPPGEEHSHSNQSGHDENDVSDKQDAIDGDSDERTLADMIIGTALDTVQRQVDFILDTAMGHGSPEAEPPQLKSDQVHKEPSIVSTMTKTETRTLPDGSIETRRVLRRKFADGKEEHEETVDTKPGPTEVPDWLQKHISARAAAGMTTVDKQTQTPETAQPSPPQPPREETKGGWFWR